MDPFGNCLVLVITLIFISNIIHDFHRHLSDNSGQQDYNTTINGTAAGDVSYGSFSSKRK